MPLVQVTDKEFFAAIGPRDIVTSQINPDFTSWETRNRVQVGKSFPGWREPSQPKSWFIDREAINKVPKV